VRSEGLENRPTAGVEVHPVRIEGRRLEAVRQALREQGLTGVDLIRLGSRIYAVREPVLDAENSRRPRRRRTVCSLVHVTVWDGHRPRDVEFQDALAEESA
jgi:hypothetical protein